MTLGRRDNFLVYLFTRVSRSQTERIAIWCDNRTCADSYQQNKTVFPVKWTHFYLEEKLRMHAVTLAFSPPSLDHFTEEGGLGDFPYQEGTRILHTTPVGLGRH